MKKILLTFLFLFLFCVNANALDVSAKSAVLINGTTGQVLYSKNSDEHLPMASTTKIMTALLLAEQNTPEKEVAVTKEMVTVEGSSMGLLPGDTVSFNDLLYGMLLASGNDAANTTAYILGGSIENFAKIMNKKAMEIGLLHTNFVTPSGLDSEEHYTTAKDLALLSRYAMKNEHFAKAAGSKTATLCYGNPPYKRSVRNHNKLLNAYTGLIGVKTGFTKRSGRCLVTAAKRGEEYLIAVTLNAPNDWSDHTQMLDYGFSVLNEYSFPAYTSQINVVGGAENKINIYSPEIKIGLTDSEYKKITAKTELPRFVYAPVDEKQEIGTISYYYNDEFLCKKSILSQSTMNKYSELKNSFLDLMLSKFLFLIKKI